MFLTLVFIINVRMFLTLWFFKNKHMFLMPIYSFVYKTNIKTWFNGEITWKMATWRFDNLAKAI